ncbi:MAG: outer membrane protein assembly factor BamD [Candidatus Rokubacteria bacterium]|nr:outer membrane protein assembly factor BamD [Candidatus Rokubacteria bacterium]
MSMAFSRALAGALILLALGGCGLLTQRPEVIPAAAELYERGETELGRKRYEEARTNFRRIVERHPESSYAPRARFLMGEAYYREAEFDKATKEFEAFMSFYPRHMIADLVQYRLAMSYYDQMKPVEQDQGLTQKAVEQFKRLVKEYPESRYAPDALAKIDVCRGRLAQKELWVANYYWNQGNLIGVRQRLEAILKDYPRTLVVPETLFLLAEVNAREGLVEEAAKTFRRLAEEYPYTEWGRRAAQRLSTSAQR